MEAQATSPLTPRRKSQDFVWYTSIESLHPISRGQGTGKPRRFGGRITHARCRWERRGCHSLLSEHGTSSTAFTHLWAPPGGHRHCLPVGKVGLLASEESRPLLQAVGRQLRIELSYTVAPSLRHFKPRKKLHCWAISPTAKSLQQAQGVAGGRRHSLMPPATVPSAAGGVTMAPVLPGSGVASESEKPLPKHELLDLPEDVRKALDELRQSMQAVFDADSDMKSTFENMHAGYPDVAYMRFLKAREFDPVKAHKMLSDCLQWRIKNDIDGILARPLLDDKHEKVRASQQYGMCGYDYEGRPVLCVRVGLSFHDPDIKLEEYVHSHIQHNEYRDRVLLPEASRRKGQPVTTSVKIYDMSGLKLAHLGRMQMHRAVASIDDLSYPEKSEVYYVVNAPSVFGACWKAVKPLLQERTKKKVQVLEGNGYEELLKDMDEEVLPHFVRFASREGLGSSKNLVALATHPALQNPSLDCCSPSHPYHSAMQAYMVSLRQKTKAGGLGKSESKREIPVEADTGRRGEETDIGTVLEEALSQVAVSEGTAV